MILTPPDIFSQTLLAIPMWMLFEIGILFGSLVSKNKRGDHPDEQSGSDAKPPAPQA
jgi:sec-independent protein translocase protein TatC